MRQERFNAGWTSYLRKSSGSCNGILGRHCLIFANSRKTYSPCSTGFDYTKERNWTQRKYKIFTQRIDYYFHVIHHGLFEVSMRAINDKHALEHWKTVSELKSFLGFCKVFGWFLLNFTCVGASLNNELRKGQLPTIHGLRDENITLLKRLEANLVDCLCLPFYDCKDATPWTLTYATSRLDVFFYRKNITLPAN